MIHDAIIWAAVMVEGEMNTAETFWLMVEGFAFVAFLLSIWAVIETFSGVVM